MSEQERGLDSLIVWQRARELMLFVHRQIVPQLPETEKWDLTSQIRRSSKSVMANIAEGYGRYYYQENVRFCYIARGSLVETSSHLITARDLGYISPALFEEGTALLQETQRILNGYIAYLKKSKHGGNLPEGRLKEPMDSYTLNPDPLAPELP